MFTTSDSALHDGSVLLMERDEAVRHVLTRCLRGAGYSVFDHPDVPSALAALHASDEPFDLVIVDTSQPVLGERLAIAAQTRWPGVPVLFMPGESTVRQFSSVAGASPRFVLPKPFDGRRLTYYVGSIVGGRSSIAAG